MKQMRCEIAMYRELCFFCTDKSALRSITLVLKPSLIVIATFYDPVFLDTENTFDQVSR